MSLLRSHKIAPSLRCHIFSPSDPAKYPSKILLRQLLGESGMLYMISFPQCHNKSDKTVT